MKAISFLTLSGAAFALVFIVLLAVIRLKAKRGKESQNGLIESLRKENPNFALARIYVARPEHFRRRMKIVGFESRAVLQVGPESVKLAGLLDGNKMDWIYSKRDLALEWIGNPGLGSSNLHWISIGRGEKKVMLSADTGFVAVQSREATADLCALIDPAFALPGIAKAEFALERNPASLGAVVLFFSLLVFAFADGILLNPYELVDHRVLLLHLLWLVPLSALLTIPSYLFLTKNKVPSRESLVLSTILVSGIVCATVPAAKRIDQWLSPGSVPYEYSLVAATRLEPVHPGPPVLNFFQAREYWAQFEKNSVHRFNLIHGPLGLWQLDHAGLDEPIRLFYEERGKGKQGMNGKTP